MSRKDYARFAELVKFDLKLMGLDDRQRLLIAIEICKIFKSDNLRFNQKTFLSACGFEE